MVNFKLKMPSNPIKTREDGTKIIGGQSLREWIHSVSVLIVLWIIMGCIWALFMFIAQSVRDAGVLYPRPSRTCVPGDFDCFETFPGQDVCGVGKTVAEKNACPIF